MSENNLTHFDAAGNAVMVDVSEKTVTFREATAHGIITMNAEAFAAVESGTVKFVVVLVVCDFGFHGLVGFCCWGMRSFILLRDGQVFLNTDFTDFVWWFRGKVLLL